MRLVIAGDNETARTVRGYLRKAGLAVAETRPDVTIHIEEDAAANYISFNSLHSDLEVRLLREVRSRTREPLLLSHGTHPRGERHVHIIVPDREAARVAVELGILQGILEWTAHPAKRSPFWKRLETKLKTL